MKKALKGSIGKILLFEILFKFITVTLFIPILQKVFIWTINIAGLKFLSTENIGKYLTNPIVIVLLIILLVLMGIYAVFDVGVIVNLVNAAISDKKMKISEAIVLSGKKALIKPKNFGFVIILVIVFPFIFAGLGAGAVRALELPEFISDFIVDNTVLSILVAIVMLILLVMLVRWRFALNLYILGDYSFKESRKKSLELGKKSHIKDFVYIVVVQLIRVVFFVALTAVGILIIVGISSIFTSGSNAQNVIIGCFILIMAGISNALAMALLFLAITVRFHKNATDKNMPIDENVEEVSDKTSKVVGIISIIIAVIAAVIMALYTGGLVYKYVGLNTAKMEVTAHRGASEFYPENTMSAFKGGLSLGADWEELDVQQTKDGVIIVSHDTNLKRVTGQDVDINDATYDEIKDLDAGSFKGAQFAGERVPTLDEVIKWAKENNTKLNIEIKPTGKETDFEKGVIDVINKYDFADQCIVTSLNYEALKNVKKIDKNINTVSVMAVAIGDIGSMTDADGFSLEAANIDPELVNRMHMNGKEVYAWTVNTEDTINKMIDMDVDNIITNDVELCKKLIDETNNDNDVNRIVVFVRKILNVA